MSSTDTYTELRRRDHYRAMRITKDVYRVAFPTDGPGVERYAVPSSSEPGTAHLVSVWGITQLETDCDCIAFRGDSGKGMEPRRTCIHTACVERRLIREGRMADPLAERPAWLGDRNAASLLYEEA